MKPQLTKIITYLDTLNLPTDHITQPETLYTAFVHKSYAADFNNDHPHNERLEFLWDWVVWLVINHLLYNNFPHEAESNLTLRKISLVRQDTLALVAHKIWLDQMIIIGNGEERKWWRNNDAILCDCFEALVWWIYLDLGWEQAYQFIHTHVYSMIDNINIWPIKSYKSLIQEHVQSQYKVLPEYLDREKSRDDRRNEVIYETSIIINWQVAWVGIWSSKRKAQEEAAKDAYETINQLPQ